MILSGDSVDLSAESDNNISQSTVIHIKTTLNKDSSGVDIKCIALLHMVIKHCTAKVICRSNCVHITRKVKIYVLHWKNLCVSAACGTSLDSENRTERRLSKCNYCILSDFSHSLSETCCCSCFTLSGRGRVDCGYKDKFAVRVILYPVCKLVGKLCFVFSVKFEFVFRNSDFCGYFFDWHEFSLLSYFNIR